MTLRKHSKIACEPRHPENDIATSIIGHKRVNTGWRRKNHFSMFSWDSNQRSSTGLKRVTEGEKATLRISVLDAMDTQVQVISDSGTHCQKEMETLELRGRTLCEDLHLTLHGPTSALTSRLLFHFPFTSSKQSFYLSSLAKKGSDSPKRSPYPIWDLGTQLPN